MDTFNLYKEYSKVNQLEDQNSIKTQIPKNPNWNWKPYFTIPLILLSLLLGSTIAALIVHSHTQGKLDLDSSDSNTATRSIELVCKVTRYYDSCFSTLTSINTRPDPDPESLFSLSLNATIRELSKLAVTLPDSLSYRVTEPRTRSALEDCRSLLADGIEQLNLSAATVKKGHVASSPEVKIRDMNTWISAAMTNQETCLDGLEEVESTVVEEVRAKVHASNVCLSNSLAILVNIKKLVDKFHQQVLH